jgi:hypothetical protein
MMKTQPPPAGNLQRGIKPVARCPYYLLMLATASFLKRFSKKVLTHIQRVVLVGQVAFLCGKSKTNETPHGHEAAQD